jgi:hypothetical protein
VIGKVEKEVAKASSLMEGVEAEIGKKRAVSRKVGCLGGWVGGWVPRAIVCAGNEGGGIPRGCGVAQPVPVQGALACACNSCRQLTS